MLYFFTSLLLLLFVPVKTNGQGHSSLRRGVYEALEEVAVGSESLVTEIQSVRRDLSSIVSCEKSTSMLVPLVPTNMRNELDDPAFSTMIDNSKNFSPNYVLLTFCLDHILLELHYVLDEGTLVTGLDIECPQTETINFLEPNYVFLVQRSFLGKRSRFFSNGVYTGETKVDNVDILRILASGEQCEFKVKAYHFEEGLLVGKLRNDAFTNSM